MKSPIVQRVISNLNRLLGACNPYFEAVTRSPNDALEYSIRSGRIVYDQFAGWNDFCGKVVLDYGCGAGGKTLFYARQGPSLVVGADVSLPVEKAVEYARTHNIELEFFLITVDGRIPLPPSSCDVVINSSVLEHLPDPDKTFRELRRVLKPGGLLLNRWHPYRSRYGAHLWSAIGIPFAHLIFPEEDLVRVYCRTLRERFGKIPAAAGKLKAQSRTFADLAYHLNRYSVSRMRASLERAGFELLDRRFFVGKRRVRYPHWLPECVVDFVIDYEVQICRTGKTTRVNAPKFPRLPSRNLPSDSPDPLSVIGFSPSSGS